MHSHTETTLQMVANEITERHHGATLPAVESMAVTIVANAEQATMHTMGIGSVFSVYQAGQRVGAGYVNNKSVLGGHFVRWLRFSDEAVFESLISFGDENFAIGLRCE